MRHTPSARIRACRLLPSKWDRLSCGCWRIRREEHFVAATADCFADQLFVVADAVGVRGIEKIDAEVKRAEDCSGGVCVVALAVEFAHAHAAESHAGDDCALGAEFYFSHCHEVLDDCG